MKNVNKNFESMVEHVNKIASLKLENREEAVIMAMLNSGVGASANPTIQKLSNALNTTKTNNFRAAQEEETLFGPSFNAEKFNLLNKDIEAILESGYNARIIDQTINVSNMINGKGVSKTKGEIVLHTLDNMNIKNPKQTMSYSDFDAKYNTLLSFIELAGDHNLRLAPSNKLYLYNSIINLMNEIDTNNINTDVNFIKKNVGALNGIENDNLKNYLSNVTVGDMSKIANEVKSKRESLDYVRKDLEQQIFNKAEEKFNMEKCHDKFVRAVEYRQRENMALRDEEEVALLN